MAKLFISFVEEDDAVAQAVKRLLEQEFHGRLEYGDVFLSSDRWVLRHGENWMDRIKTELTECCLLISLLSKRSIEMRWINFEGGAAWVANKLQPVRFGNLTMDNIPRPYSDFIVVDLRGNPYGLIQAVSDALRVADVQAARAANRLVPPPPRTPMPFAPEDDRTQELRRVLDGFVDAP